jgi:hypothetical protein
MVGEECRRGAGQHGLELRKHIPKSQPTTLSLVYFDSILINSKVSRRTSEETMAEHNIVVLAGDHCGPEVRRLLRGELLALVC